MNYYDLMYDFNHSEGLLFLSIDEETLPFGRYDVYEAKDLPVDRIVCSIDEEQTDYCDYIANDLIWLVVSDKAKRIMEDFELGNTRFIDMVDRKSGKTIGYLVHCMNHLDIFDEENAVCDRLSNGWLSVVKPAIYGEKVGTLDLFKLKEYDMPFFVSERLKKALQKNNCIGFDYLKIKS